ncbi:D-alanine-D-alanine ligase [Thermotomaculum hydrothermale]|uniref:D-alanine--D-alanine ligase n=1 Tax=Thermotomaculum hydrothermale TaxID=981385 RepID=A0A7R6SZP4_9BACT|nr:D-alanine--D-alanine ligase family protein [Thermotomaculum hydrothermale]BBB32957.1 D-alanine-D-alanine ligase [Thermotomaculum hydrothermale]
MIKTAIVFGGKSPEHPISILSAKAVYKNIDREKFDVSLIAITKNGDFFSGEGAFEFLENGDKSKVKQVDCGIFKLFDVIFPVLHGPYGEDGTIQGMLDFLGVPYVGCGVEASAIAMHKGISRDLFKIAQIPQPEYIYLTKKEKEQGLKDALEKLNFPLFVKPCRGGSSIGITKVKHAEKFKDAVELAFQYDSEVIVEEGISVTKELEVAVLGNHNLIISPPGALIPGDEFYTYEDKYVETKTKFSIPAKIPKEVEIKIKSYAEKAFKVVKGKGMARIDFLYDENENKVFLNEINTIPGFTEISMYPKLMALCGFTFKKLTTKLIELALEND